MRTIVLDIETMGVTSDAAVLSVGAVLVDSDRTKIEDTLEIHFDLNEVMAMGGRTSADTLLWWLDQPEDARAAVLAGQKQGTMSLQTGLAVLSMFIMGEEAYHDEDTPVPFRDVEVWAQGDSFDNVILTNMYQRQGLKAPWAFYRNRDLRTLIAEYERHNRGDSFVRATPTVKHSALADAEASALDLIRLNALMAEAIGGVL